MPERERYERARELLARADRNQRSFGERWGQRDLERFAAEDRALLEGSRDPADHAHRAGYERASFEALRGPERERAEEAIEKARRRDRRRLEVAADPPGRIAGRGRQAAETLRQRSEGSAPQRREHLRGLRRERRAANAFPGAPQPQPRGIAVQQAESRRVGLFLATSTAIAAAGLFFGLVAPDPPPAPRAIAGHSVGVAPRFAAPSPRLLAVRSARLRAELARRCPPFSRRLPAL